MNRARNLLIVCFVAVSSASAQWAVIDASNLKQSVMNYAALVEQLANQAEQISHQLRQIEQFETELRRMGDMASVKVIVGFPEFRIDLERPTKITPWVDRRILVDGSGLFGDTRGGTFREIAWEFPNYDGDPVARAPDIYRQEHDMVVTVDEFVTVQQDVLSRREALKVAIANTSEALVAADTVAEQQKLEAVLNAQYSQLVAVDAEVAQSAVQVQVKAAETAALDSAQTKAEAEAHRRLAQAEAEKISAAFKPRYESMLQFVRETRLPD